MDEVRKQAMEDLVKYVNFQIGNEKHKRCIIKPKGAFKESPYFYAEFDRCGDYFHLRVRVDTIQYNNGCDLVIFHECLGNPVCYNDSIRRAVNILDSIYFNQYYGEFHTFQKNDKIGNYGSIMKRLWNMDKEITCCVCNEETVTETACGHRLCIICWAKVNSKCPLCRSDISCYEDSDNEED